jgi:ferredoxin-NADP reductase
VTAAGLLWYIISALLLQLATGATIAIRRRRRRSEGAFVAAGSVHSASPAAWHGWREFRVARREFEDRALTQCSFLLEPVDAVPLPPYSPGQFLTFSVPVSQDRAVIRCYSLSDRPNPASYRITVKRVPAPADHPGVPPGASSNYFHDRVHEGDVLRAKAPAGTFCIDPDSDVPLVLIAGGIGITPMMSIVLWCSTAQPRRIIHLYYGVRNGRDHAFRRSLEQLAQSHPGIRLKIAYSKPDADDQPGRDFHHLGHVDAELLRRTLPHGRHQFYVCGPTAMMAGLIPSLSQSGVPAEDIHFEAFGPASLRSARVADESFNHGTISPLEIKLQRSGRTLMWTGQDRTLLDFGERNGVDIESGCRAGSCGTCETRLVFGTVRYAHPPDHQIAAGCCLLCVGTPETALVLEI